MDRLNYHPNWFARGLNLGKTRIIALLIPNIDSLRYREIMSGVETVALKKQYTVLLCSTHADPGKEAEYLDLVMDRQVDGLILVSPVLDPGQMGALLGPEQPWVQVGPGDALRCRNICYINYEEGAFQMTTHLIKMGQRNICLLIGDASLPEMRQIAAGYRRAIAQREDHGEGIILNAEDTVRGGYLLTKKLLHAGTLPPALIAASDDQAAGILKALQDEKISVPGRMALGCLADSSICSVLDPPVTALEAPTRRLGMVAARMLFDEIEDSDGELNGPQEIILQPKLKIRRSCGNTKQIYELFT